MSRLDNQETWKNTHRDRWFAEGFRTARQRAVDIVLAVAENEDWRPEQARMAGAKPGRSVRILKRAANFVRSMSRPKRPDAADVEEPE